MNINKIIKKQTKKNKNIKGKLDLIISNLNNINHWNYENNTLLRNILNEKRRKKQKTIKIQTLSNNIIEQIILDFIKLHSNEDIYPSDIAFSFNLDRKKVFEIYKKLKKEGKLI